MAITPIEKLLEEIKVYPEELRRAIERKLKAESLVAKLAQEFTDEKDHLAHSDEENDTPPNERVEMLKLDLEIEKLQLRYEQKKGNWKWSTVGIHL